MTSTSTKLHRLRNAANSLQWLDCYFKRGSPLPSSPTRSRPCNTKNEPPSLSQPKSAGRGPQRNPHLYEDPTGRTEACPWAFPATAFPPFPPKKKTKILCHRALMLLSSPAQCKPSQANALGHGSTVRTRGKKATGIGYKVKRR